MFLTIIDIKGLTPELRYVAIPSNRVNVSYPCYENKRATPITSSQSPQIGSMFLTRAKRFLEEMFNYGGRNPLKSGQCFLPWLGISANCVAVCNRVAIPSNRVNVSYRRQEMTEFRRHKPSVVAIPSNRVNVSYRTYFFLHIIGNLTPLFREPHYFYAFFFPI